MEEITVTATRAAKDPFKTPNAITVLNLKQLERSNVEHASNLLRDSVGRNCSGDNGRTQDRRCFGA